MIWIIVLLLFVGIMLIILEAVVPHGLSVIAGVAVIGLSVYLCFRSFGSQLGTVYLIMAVVMAGISAFVVFKSGVRYLALRPVDHPKGGSAEDPNWPPIGEWLRVTQPLRPTGTVEWQGRRYPARNLRPEIEAPVGARVQLRAHDSVYLLVELGEEGGKE